MSKRSASYGNAHNKRARNAKITLVTGYNRATGGMTAAARGKSLNRVVAAAVRKTVEKKGCDFPMGGTGAAVTASTNTNADCYVVNLVQQGAGSWNRVGRKIQLQSLRLRGSLLFTYDPAPSTGNLTGNTLRMVVVWDKQPSGAAIPTYDTVFGVTGQDGSETSTFLNPVKYDNMDRFSVLRDCVIDFDPKLYNASALTQGRVIEYKTFDEFIPLKGREVVFLGQTVPMTIADISTGGLYVYFRAAADSLAVTSIEVQSNSFARLRYIDP